MSISSASVWSISLLFSQDSSPFLSKPLKSWSHQHLGQAHTSKQSKSFSSNRRELTLFLNLETSTKTMLMMFILTRTSFAWIISADSSALHQQTDEVKFTVSDSRTVSNISKISKKRRQPPFLFNFAKWSGMWVMTREHLSPLHRQWYMDWLQVSLLWWNR